MRFLLACFLVSFLFALALSPSSPGATPEEVDLRHLSAGTVFIVKRSIFIPANADRLRITPEGSGLECYLRMNRSRPFARVIRQGRQLPVTGTDRSALSARNRIYSSTRIYLMSDSVDDILCSSGLNEGDPKIREFKQAVNGVFSLEIPQEAIEVG